MEARLTGVQVVRRRIGVSGGGLELAEEDCSSTIGLGMDIDTGRESLRREKRLGRGAIISS